LPESDLLTRWEAGPSDPDSPSYMLLMALCAASCQTASLNAVFADTLLQGASLPTCEHYFNEAVSKIPTRMAQSQDLDYLRAFGLLAVYSLQRGNHNELHRYLGLYRMVSMMKVSGPRNCPLRKFWNKSDQRKAHYAIYSCETTVVARSHVLLVSRN